MGYKKCGQRKEGGRWIGDEQDWEEYRLKKSGAKKNKIKSLEEINSTG